MFFSFEVAKTANINQINQQCYNKCSKCLSENFETIVLYPKPSSCKVWILILSLEDILPIGSELSELFEKQQSRVFWLTVYTLHRNHAAFIGKRESNENEACSRIKQIYSNRCVSQISELHRSAAEAVRRTDIAADAGHIR